MPPTQRQLSVFTSTGVDVTGALLWSTPSGHLENNVIVRAPDGQHYLVISLEDYDLVPVPSSWSTGTVAIAGPGKKDRSGIRISAGMLLRNDEDDIWGIRGLRDEKQANDNGTVVNPPGEPA